MSKLFEHCIYQHETVLSGGKSGSSVDVVRDLDKSLVRKTSHGVVPVTANGSEYDMHVIDSSYFPEGGELIVPTSICSNCENTSCLLTDYIDGKTLDEILVLDLNLEEAHQQRMKVVELMSKKGYFSQKNSSKDKSMWYQWLGKRLSLLRSLSSGDSEILAFIDRDKDYLHEVLITAIECLTDETEMISRGFFPRDVIPGNIIVDTDNHIQLIDQHVFFGDPVIIPIKLMFGWRLLSNTYTNEGASEKLLAEYLKMKDKIRTLDSEMLASIQSYYPEDHIFKARYHAAMIIRHIRGIEFLVKENTSDESKASLLSFIKEVVDYIDYEYQQLSSIINP